jgi:methionyl-tRNA formyltransferase
MLFESARLLFDSGHEIGIVWTDQAELHYGVGLEDFKQLARTVGANFVCERRINEPHNVARLRQAACSVAISANWVTLLKRGVLESFEAGVLNAHAGDLPRYRGNACPNWAILQGEPHVGFCIHFMTEGLDDGAVLARRHLRLSDEVYIGDVYDWLDAAAPAMFLEAVDGLASGTLTPEQQPQDPASALRCYPRRPEDARIDWAMSRTQVHRLIRASSRPLSGAYAFLEGEQKVIVWKAEAVQETSPYLAVPGQVCARADDDPIVACRDGLLRLTDIFMEPFGGGPAAKRAVHRSLRNRLT